MNPNCKHKWRYDARSPHYICAMCGAKKYRVREQKPSEWIRERAKELGAEVVETKDGHVYIRSHWDTAFQAIIEYLDSQPPFHNNDL